MQLYGQVEIADLKIVAYFKVLVLAATVGYVVTRIWS